MKLFLSVLSVLSVLFVLLGQQAHAAEILGTRLLNMATLGDDSITNKSIIDTSEAKGTPKQVASVALRDAIPAVRRTEGMTVWVVNESTEYRLVGGIENANFVEVIEGSTNTPAPRIRKISQIVSRKNREALSNELVIAQFLFTGGPASNTLAYNPRNVGPSRSLFIRDAMQCVEAHPLFFQPDQLRGWARAFTNNISGIDLFCSEEMQNGVNGYGPYFDSQFDFVWLTYEHYRKTRAPTLFLEMQPRIEAAITRVKSSPFMSNSIPFVSLDTMGGWGFHDTILFETNYNVGMDMQSAMFWVRTCRQLSEMYFASGQFAKGSNALVDLSRTSASVMTNFWSEERGLFRAYQLSITNHSIVGSALAVVYDAVPKAVQQRIIAELISGLPGGEDFAAGNGFFKNGGIRFWPANEQPGITNSQNGGYWPGFAAYVARAIQYDAPDVAEHIVSYHITNTVRLVQVGVTNHIRVGQLEWFGAELSVDPTAFGYNNNIQSQAGGVIEPVSTEVFSGFVEGEGSFSKISSMTNGPLEIPSETRFGGGTFPHTLDPGGLVLDNGETTTPSLRFVFGNNLNFGIGSDSFTLWFVYNFLETNGVVLGRWQGDGKLLSLGGFLAAGGVFAGDGSGLTNLTIPGITAALTNNETRSVTLSNTLSVVGETKIGGGNFAHIVSPGLRLDNGETTTPSLKFAFGDNLNYAIGSDALTLWFVYNLNEAGGTVLGRWQGDGLLLSLGGFRADGGQFTGDGAGLTNLPFNALSLAGRQAVTNAASGGGTPAGSDGNVQYNNAGVTGGENALFWDDTNDRLGIGETAPASKLSVSGNLSVGSGYTTAAPANGAIIEGNVGIGTATPSAATKLFVTASSATSGFATISSEVFNTATALETTYAIITSAYNQNASGSTIVNGARFIARDLSTGTASGNYVVAINSTAQQSSTRPVASLLGFYGQTVVDASVGTVSFAAPFSTTTSIGTGSTLSDLRHFEAVNPTGDGTLSAQYGLYVPNLTKGAVNYSIYAGSAPSYFGGNVGIGETAPGSKLAVSGNLSVGAGYDTTAAPANGLLVEGLTISTGGFKSQTSTGNAPAGGLGEYVESLVALGSAVSLTTATAANVTSISLTAGDWDVRGNVNFSESGVTVTETVGGITATTAAIPTDGSEVYSGAGIGAIGLSAKDSVTLPAKRISLSGTTTIYLVAKSTFSVGTVSAYGAITARRVQ